MKAQASPKISLTAMPEPETLRLARAGNSDAFAALYNEHREDVYLFIYRRVQHVELAHDLTQDTFLRALRRLETFTWQGRSIAAWLMTIARNLIIDHYKKESTRRETSVAEMLDADELVESAEQSALEQLVATQTRVAVKDALKLLTAPQRATLELRYLRDMSIQETADSMGLTVGAVKTMTYRAMRAASRRLAPMRGAA